MRKFRFKLQTVLEHRRFREDRLQGELGELRREEAREVARLGELCCELESAREAILDGLAGNEPADELERRDEYAKAKRDDVRVQELTLDAVRQRVDAKREEVIEAMKRRKVLEALRDKQESAYLYESARAEQNELDADASVRYARRT
jgi:flagellar FliJ protein